MTARRPSGLFDLDGQVVLVTGAGGGLGQAVARACASHGADLVLVDRVACDEVARECREIGARVHALRADFAQPAQVESMCGEALAAFGRVDTLVCNAGMQGPAGPIGEVRMSDWDEVLRVNLFSAQTMAARLVPAMAARGAGAVVLMASIAALRGNKSIGLYGVSKAALAQLARNLAVEWGPRGVRVNAIAPGLIRTPLSEGLMGDAAFMQRRLAATPLRRVGEPDEIAGLVVMLAARAGGFVTGQTLVADGGTLIGDGS